jgi:hypothetical protein
LQLEVADMVTVQFPQDSKVAEESVTRTSAIIGVSWLGGLNLWQFGEIVCGNQEVLASPLPLERVLQYQW